MPKKSRVLVVDDHPVIVEAIKKIIEDEPDFEFIGSAKDGEQSLSIIKSLKPDIVILDILMPHMDGVEVAHQLKEQNTDTRILVYSFSASKEYITALFRSGISGYLLKEEPFSELILALRTVREGAVFYSRVVRDTLQDHVRVLEIGEEGKNVADVQDGLSKLSVREKEVFVLLADGLSSKEIADRLFISPKTVESHKYNIMDKLNVKSLADFTKIAVRKQLIKI
jgi:DNA-binding NarL/FixJ family response regulator